MKDKAFTQEGRVGDANFMPLADGAVYRLIITQSGFNTEPENDVAKAATERRI